MLRRVAPWLAPAAAVFILGVVVTACGFGSYAGAALPDQDPTPETQATQAARTRDGLVIMTAGLAPTALGVLALLGVGGWVLVRTSRRSDVDHTGS